MSWATLEDVTSITGSTVSATDLAIAQGVIEIYANRTSDVTDTLAARDLAWLKRAVSWQAKFVADTPGYGSQPDASSVSQDGLSVQTRYEYSQHLAPMAARALKNLTWKANRTERVEKISTPVGAGMLLFLEDDGDVYSNWQPLEGVD